MGASQQTPTNLNHPADSTDKVIVTANEARKMGIPWTRKPPENGSCPFCGKVLEPQGVVFMGEVVLWQPFLPRCDCEQAKAYWEKHDQEEAAKKAAAEEEARRKALRDKVESLLGKSGIKKRFQQRTFPNFICDTPGRLKNFQIAKQYADNFAAHQKRGGRPLHRGNKRHRKNTPCGGNRPSAHRRGNPRYLQNIQRSLARHQEVFRHRGNAGI